MTKVVVGLLPGFLLVGGGVVASPVDALPRAGRATASTPPRLEIYHTPPVLVRADERVLVPVDVVCSTPQGQMCDAKVTLRVRDGEGGGDWSEVTTDAGGRPVFDFRSPLSRVLERASTGAVDYSIRARDTAGRSAVVPETADGESLRFYVTRSLPVLDVPAVGFREPRKGETVLFLPWGSGGARAGIAPGKESATLGPTAFDVDASGRIHLLDPEQDRLAVFSRGSLVREVSLEIGPRSLIAATSGGGSYVVDSGASGARGRSISPGGDVSPGLGLGEGIPAQLETVGGEAFVNMLPLDAWVRASSSRARPEQGAAEVTTGMPAGAGEQLLRVADERFVRLAMVRNGRIHGQVELRSAHRFGDVALAAADKAGGYRVVVRVWEEAPSFRAAYVVVHVRRDLRVTAFPVSADSFAEVTPGARFRIGRDGDLYQMRTSADGMRIQRYDLGGGDR